MRFACLVSAQNPTVQVLGSGELRSQYTAKVVLRLERKQHVNYVLGEEAANAGWRADLVPADKPGTLYLDAAGATVPMRGRAFEVTQPTIDQVVERYATRRPSLTPPPSPRCKQPVHPAQARVLGPAWSAMASANPDAMVTSLA